MKEITVIKFGGSLAKNESAKKKFLDELAVLSNSLLSLFMVAAPK